MKDNTLVSIVIPFFSNKLWLEQAIDSILEQTYQIFEIIIVNDGSSENIKNFEKRDRRIKIINKENGGPASARNLGIKKSQGEYIAFLDSDDIWLPQKLEMQLKFMKEKNIIWSQHSYFYMYNDDLRQLKKIDTKMYKGDVTGQLFTSFKIQTSTIMVQRMALFDKYGSLIISFREDARYGQDMYFYLELAKRYKLYFLDKYLSYFRIRKGNAGFRGIVQINARQMLWDSLKSDENLYNKSNLITKLGYKINSINYAALQKFSINEKIAKKINLPSKIFFKLAFIYENIIKKSKV